MAEYFETPEEAEDYIRRASRPTELYARIRLHGSEKWMVDHDRRNLGSSITILDNLTGTIDRIRTVTSKTGTASTERFKACPNCGKTRSPYGASSTLNVFRCSCGKVYCDDCSGGGLIDLPRCPVSAYHEGMKKVGAIPSLHHTALPSGVAAPISKQIEIEAESLEEARKQVESQLSDDEAVLEERIVAGGMPETLEAVADTVSDAYKKAEQQMRSGARIEKKEVCTEPKLSSFELPGEDEQSARKLVSLRHGQRVDSFTLKTPGQSGFLGFGKKRGVFQADIFQQAVVRVTFRSKVKVRYMLGTLHDKFEKNYDRLGNLERERILRQGKEAERVALLRALTNREGSDENNTLLAAIDLLALGSSKVRQEAMKFLLAKDSMPATAWKLAYELRDRALYNDELVMPQTRSISAFEKTPALGSEKARSAVDFVRSYPLEEKHKKTFEERFAYFSRNERTISEAEVDARHGDKTLCLQCGKKMKITPQGPYVQLRCDTCDISRIEKREDIR